jgi:hypothetical protein
MRRLDLAGEKLNEKNAKWPLTKAEKLKYKGIILKDLESENFY